MITIERGSPSITLTRSDGKVADLPLQAPVLRPSSSLASLHLAPGRALLATTVSGEEFGFEMPLAAHRGDAESRVSVYLDQKDWSQLARALSSPNEASEQDLSDAEQLANWVESRVVILPISSGHYYETTKWTVAERRLPLGLVMLRLSRGWQLRDPLQVRRNEVRSALRAFASLDFPPPEGEDGVVTLHPDSLRESRSKHIRAPKHFPPDLALAYRAAVSATSHIEVILDQDHLVPDQLNSWELANQDFSDWLDVEPRDANQKRKCIDLFLLADFKQVIAEEALAAGITPEQMTEWIEQRFAHDLASMAATGLYREMVHNKHLNKGYRWEHNDLVDMTYLTCAAGYCDFVVCERSATAALDSGQRRLGRERTVFRNLRQALPAIAERVG